MTLKSFLKECNEKDVFKRLSIYIVSSWVLIQVLAVTWEPIGIPKKSVTFLIIALLVGLPIYIFYIWKYHLQPLEKLKKVRISKKGVPKKSGFQKLYFSSLGIISILSLMAVVLIIQNNFFKSVKLPTQIATDKIAILEFGNNTGDPRNDIVSKMASDWISHGITQHQLGQVVSPEVVTEYVGFLQTPEGDTDDKSVLNTYFKPAKVITGNYYLDGDKLLFQCSITNGDYSETFISFEPISCDKESPLECIETLKQIVLGFLITEVTPELNLQETPPKYEAYQHFIDATAIYSNEPDYLALLNKAIEADSNYFEPKVMRVAYYYNIGEYKTADSLRKSIVPNSMSSTRQINLLGLYDALLDGNNKKIYNHTMKEYQIAPFDITTNASAMVVGLQYVNKPEIIDSIFKAVPMTGMDIENCTQCQYRYYVEGLAEVQLKEYDKAIKTLTPITDIIDDLYLKRPLMSAHIRSGDFKGLDKVFTKLKLSNSEDELKSAYLFAGKESILFGHEGRADEYLNNIISLEEVANDKDYTAFAYYYKGEFEKAENFLKQKIKNAPDDTNLLTLLAISYSKNGKNSEAKKLLERLESLRGDYQFGSIDYALSQYYAATGEEERSYEHLFQSVAEGNTFTTGTFQNDPHFKEYLGTPAFENILTFWH
ncbi:hypothetical protein J1N09_06040 [Aureitalea sp. L0-47]|uniref:tetratricopeptide repeat protein n=1 Tax=Aureitalea sp. L0-47 TaxID=2816962 RepID=UPI0022374E4E|nr:tetratricopeptide repeat protein [Aureitalea sp. L0-47]MCW5519389.1 hypothetical protein [Aureitalea sp. L0-47]